MDTFKKKRRHHNNKGYRQIKSGKVKRDLRYIARKLKIPYKRPRREEKE